MQPPGLVERGRERLFAQDADASGSGGVGGSVVGVVGGDDREVVDPLGFGLGGFVLDSVCQSGYPRVKKSSLAEAIDSSALLRSAPAVSSAELSIRIARRCGPPKKFAGPPPPTIPTRNFRWLIVHSPWTDANDRTTCVRNGTATPSRAARSKTTL